MAIITQGKKTIFDELAASPSSPPSKRTIFDEIASEGPSSKKTIFDELAVDKPTAPQRPSRQPKKAEKPAAAAPYDPSKHPIISAVKDVGSGALESVNPIPMIKRGYELWKQGDLEGMADLITGGLFSNTPEQLAAAGHDLKSLKPVKALEDYAKSVPMFGPMSQALQEKLREKQYAKSLGFAGGMIGMAALPALRRGDKVAPRPVEAPPVEEVPVVPERPGLPAHGAVKGLLNAAPEEVPPEAPKGTFVGTPGGSVIMGTREYTVSPDGTATEVIRGRGAAGLLGTVPTRAPEQRMPPSARPGSIQKPRQITGQVTKAGTGEGFTFKEQTVPPEATGETGVLPARKEQTITPIAKKGGRIRPPIKPEAQVLNGVYHDLPKDVPELAGFHPETLDLIRGLVSSHLEEMKDTLSQGSENLLGAKTGTLIRDDATGKITGKFGGFRNIYKEELESVGASPAQISEVIKPGSTSKYYRRLKTNVTRTILERNRKDIEDYEYQARERGAIQGEQAYGSVEFGGKQELPPLPERETAAGKTSAKDIEQTLGASLLPGLPEFVKEMAQKHLIPELNAAADIILPFANKVFGWPAEIGKAFQQEFLPRIGTPKAGLDAIYEMKGGRDMASFILQATFDKAAKDFDRMPREEQVAYIDRFKRGSPQLVQFVKNWRGKTHDFDLRRLNDQHLVLEARMYSQLNELKPEMPFKENHFQVMWKVKPGDLGVFRKNIYDRMTPEQARDFLDRYNSNHQQATPELQRYADYYRERLKEKLPEILGKPLGRIGGYLMGPFKRRPITGSETFKYKSTLADMSEGLALGGEPWTYNPQRMLEMSMNDGMKFLTAHRMWDKLKDIGLAEFVPAKTHPRPGFAKFGDKLSEVYLPVGKSSKMNYAGDWYVEENVARLLNRFVGKDYWRDPSSKLSLAGRPIMWAKNQMTAFELGLSGFHYGFEGHESISSDIALNLRKIVNVSRVQRSGKPVIEGLKGLSKSIISPFSAKGTTYRIGGNVIRMATESDFRSSPEGQALMGQYPEIDNIIRDMFLGGGRLSMHEDYKLNSMSAAKEAWREIKESPSLVGKTGHAVELLSHTLPAINNAIMIPLFEKFVPRLKAGAFVKEYSVALTEHEPELRAGTLTRGELARKTWDFVDDRFGEMNFQNQFLRPTVKTTMQMLFRSVTWLYGNVRASTMALPEQAMEFAKYARERKTVPERVALLDPKLAWLASMTALTAITGSLIQYAFTGKKPESIKDTIYPRVDKDDDSQRLSQPTYARTLASYYFQPGRSLESSQASFISRSIELLRNADFYNNQIYDPDDPIWSKTLDAIGNYMPIPFSATSAYRLHQAGTPSPVIAMSPAGYTKAPGYISESSALLAAKDAAKQMYPRGARPKGSATAGQKKAQLKSLYARDQVEYQKQKDDAVEKGILDQKDVDSLEKSLGVDPLVSNMKRLEAGPAMEIYINKCTSKEREQLGDIIDHKFNLESFKKMPVAQKRRILLGLQKLGWNVQDEIDDLKGK